MLLAADVGGTRVRVGIFEPASDRPAAVHVESLLTAAFADLTSLIQEFLRRVGVPATRLQSACFGVAGPVSHGRARLTNVTWEVDANSIARDLGLARVDLINDLQAIAWSVPILENEELETLWNGDPDPGGSIALIAAGTGLGVALLPRIDGRFRPQASEGGHVDFAARTSHEQKLHSALIRQFGRADLEQVVSGQGLVNIHRFVNPHTCVDIAAASDAAELPAMISRAAFQHQCPECRSTLELFVSVYGASAGNLALTALSTGGLFLGGGIAPRILPALQWPQFLEAFFAKAPLESLVRRVPVKVILNERAGVLGAAAFAQNAARS